MYYITKIIKYLFGNVKISIYLYFMYASWKDYRLVDQIRIAKDYISYMVDSEVRWSLIELESRSQNIVYTNNDKPLPFHKWLEDYKKIIYE